MKYEFKIYDYLIKPRANSAIPETPQQFINRTSLKTDYVSIINIENENMKIITNAIESNEDISSYNISISDIKEIEFQKLYMGNKVIAIIATVLIILLSTIMCIVSKSYRYLGMLFLLGGLLRIILVNTLEIMEIRTYSDKKIPIPIRRYMEKHDYYLDKMKEELYEYNSNLIIRMDQHEQHIRRMNIYNKLFLIYLCVFIIVLGVMAVV